MSGTCPECGQRKELSYPTYRKAVDTAYRLVDHVRKQSLVWHGKYAIVKHENNQLRAQLRRMKAQARQKEATPPPAGAMTDGGE